MPAQISSLSREYIYVEVVAKGVDAAELVTLPVEWAFKSGDAEPSAPDWEPGSWVPGATIPTARCLVGPGGDAVLADGEYTCWLRVTGATELPVKQLKGVLVIT